MFRLSNDGVLFHKRLYIFQVRFANHETKDKLHDFANTGKVLTFRKYCLAVHGITNLGAYFVSHISWIKALCLQSDDAKGVKFGCTAQRKDTVHRINETPMSFFMSKL